MTYFISFLEGIITFISPCMLPMIPVYVSYFAGSDNKTALTTLKNVVGFVIGFTVLFMLMGAFAGTVGGFLVRYRKIVDIISGFIICLFGLNYMGVLKFAFGRGVSGSKILEKSSFFSSVVFGVVFSVGWTPCVGAFLGSALIMASRDGETLKGIIMLLCYSMGLGIPFVISAVLTDRLKVAFDFVKRHYKIINAASGILLLLVGVLMMSGILSKYLAAFGG